MGLLGELALYEGRSYPGSVTRLSERREDYSEREIGRYPMMTLF